MLFSTSFAQSGGILGIRDTSASSPTTTQQPNQKPADNTTTPTPPSTNVGSNLYQILFWIIIGPSSPLFLFISLLILYFVCLGFMLAGVVCFLLISIKYEIKLYFFKKGSKDGSDDADKYRTL